MIGKKLIQLKLCIDKTLELGSNADKCICMLVIACKYILIRTMLINAYNAYKYVQCLQLLTVFTHVYDANKCVQCLLLFIDAYKCIVCRF